MMGFTFLKDEQMKVVLLQLLRPVQKNGSTLSLSD